MKWHLVHTEIGRHGQRKQTIFRRRRIMSRALQKLASFRQLPGTSTSGRALSTASLPDLQYDYGALEPAISGQIMELHHSKHHNTYVTGLNKAAEAYSAAEQKGDIQQMIATQQAIRFNGGGHVNHSIFWTNLCPEKDASPPEGELASAIDKDFGSLQNLQTKLSGMCAADKLQGSGWGWLGYNKDAGRLMLTTTANQDPAATQGLVPLLGIDCWEHAYYLQYKNVRPDYVKAIWKVVNWKNVAERFSAGKA